VLIPDSLNLIPDSLIPDIVSSEISLSTSDLIATLPTNKKDELFSIVKSDVELWIDTYQNVDVIQELKKIKAWLIANPTKRKTNTGMKRFINSWLSRQQDAPKLKIIEKRDNLSDFVFDENFRWDQ